MTCRRASTIGLALGFMLADAFVTPGPTGPSVDRATGSTAHHCPAQPYRPLAPDSEDVAAVSRATPTKFRVGNFIDFIGGKARQDATSLPQDPKANKKGREQELAQKKEDYRWSIEGILDVPYLEGFPPDEERPSISWILKAASVAVRTLAGTTRGTVGGPEIIEALSDPTKFKAFTSRVQELIRDTEKDIRPTDLDDYNDLHAFPMKTPSTVHDWDDDDAYARRRLQGANPVAIQKCTKEQRAKLKILEDPSYAELRKKVDDLLEDGKLFVVDHGMLNGMESDPLNGSIERYLAPGIALFEWVEDEVLPIRALGIQLNQGDGDVAMPIFTPKDPEYTWNIAKACFEASDQLCHETVFHLGYTHVVLEGPLVAMNRCLASSHPLNKLLRPHLEGTALINWAAQEILMAPGGQVDGSYASKIEASWSLVRAKALERIKGDFSPPAETAARGVSAKDLPGTYLYRDIGLKYWDAIHTWVQEYLAIYYTSEADIEGDHELAAFVNEMITEGSFLWLEEFTKTSSKLELLTKVFATFIHTGSVLHAALNFPQATSLSYVPSSPSAVYGAPPETKAEKTFEDFLAYMPPMEIATAHVTLLTILGSVYHTELGEYEGDHFTDRRVSEPLERFQDKIEDIGSELSTLNTELMSTWEARGKSVKAAKNFAYNALLPHKVPQSTNI